MDIVLHFRVLNGTVRQSSVERTQLAQHLRKEDFWLFRFSPSYFTADLHLSVYTHQLVLP